MIHLLIRLSDRWQREIGSAQACLRCGSRFSSAVRG
jgi:hypothetical protein